MQKTAMTTRLIIFGPAGSGKTTFVNAFGDFFKKYGMKVAAVNLDPGVLHVGYEPQFDIRDLFTIKKIMVRKKLGPQGAFVESVNIFNKKINLILRRIKEIDADYILFDTPGLNEIWLFQNIAGKFVEYLEKSIGLFLMDAKVCKNPKNHILNVLFSIIIELRFSLPVVRVFNKIDLLKKKELEKLKSEYLYPDELLKNVTRSVKGYLYDITKNIIEGVGARAERFIGISSTKKKGFSELEDIIYEVRCICGDLT